MICKKNILESDLDNGAQHLKSVEIGIFRLLPTVVHIGKGYAFLQRGSGSQRKWDEFLRRQYDAKIRKFEQCIIPRKSLATVNRSHLYIYI
jgi:hypothetical protein